MTVRLLAIFPEHRALLAERDRLREAVQSQETQNLILQDRLDSALADRDKLWNMAQQCISEERTAYHAQINSEWQRRGFGAPYPDAPKLPESALPSDGGGAIGSKPELPSSRVARETADFISSMVHRVPVSR